MRAVAALGVVVYHIQHMLAGGDPNNVSKLGASGVDLFFVISGFIMMYTSFNRFGTPNASLEFLRNRFVRVAPTYYLFTTITVAILLFMPGLFAELRFSLSQTISSYLFLFSRNNTGGVGMVVGVGWTLAFEAFFYAVFAVLLLLPRKWCFPLLLGVFSLGTVIGLLWEVDAPWALAMTNPITFEFLFGCAIGIWFQRGLRINRYVSSVLILIGITGLVWATSLNPLSADLDPNRALVLGLPAALIVAGCVFLDREYPGARIPWIFDAIGRSSYSLYLSHQFVLAGIALAVGRLNFSGPVWITIVLTVGLISCVMVGMLCYKFFELPVTKGLKSRRRTKLRPDHDVRPEAPPHGESLTTKGFRPPAAESGV